MSTYLGHDRGLAQQQHRRTVKPSSRRLTHSARELHEVLGPEKWGCPSSHSCLYGIAETHS